MLVVWESLRTYFLGNILENVNSLECFDEYFPKFEGKAFIFSPFLANIPILNPPENSRNLWFSPVFREHKMRTLTRNGLSTL